MSKFKKQILAGFILGIIVCGIRNISFAADPYCINYEGKITAKNAKAVEKAVIAFRIYDQETGGKILWEETHVDVAVKKGIFNVWLGSVSEIKLNFSGQCYLEIMIDKDIMRPRQKIVSEGYAFRSRFSENGFPEGAIIIWSGSISSIPTGWALCDGASGTPDLRDKFIVGASQDQSGNAKTTITGTQTQAGGAKETVLELKHLPQHRHYSEHKHTAVNHTHTVLSHGHAQTAHTHPIGSAGTGNTGGPGIDWNFGGRSEKSLGSGGDVLTAAAGDNETSSVTGDTGASGGQYGSQAGSSAPSAYTNLPPYYASAFIMRLYEKDIKR
ncbi:MAG: hypothetical protein Q8O22_02615 [Candidatus Omnitrophota bacterium]|nr:hypothetical protein [Candidatus Omnitrophota bacterium]